MPSITPTYHATVTPLSRDWLIKSWLHALQMEAESSSWSPDIIRFMFITEALLM